jgi:hypothetical protein
MGMCLQSRCLGMDVYSGSTIPAFRRHVTTLFSYKGSTQRRVNSLLRFFSDVISDWNCWPRILKNKFGIKVYVRSIQSYRRGTRHYSSLYLHVFIVKYLQSRSYSLYCIACYGGEKTLRNVTCLFPKFLMVRLDPLNGVSHNVWVYKNVIKTLNEDSLCEYI